MAQPDYVPIPVQDRVRPPESLPPPGDWRANRPGELRSGVNPVGPSLGAPGPDQGYALLLAERLEPALVLAEGEAAEDATAGCLGIALRRAALYGRAPVLADLRVAYGIWGFLTEAPAELVAYRKPLFSAAAKEYWARRAISDRVADQSLRLSPAEVAARLADWRSLLVT